MVDVRSFDISDLPPVDNLTFLRGELWRPAETFLLIRFALDGVEQKLGVRMDMDKICLLDDIVGNEALTHKLRQQAGIIWSIAAPRMKNLLQTMP